MATSKNDINSALATDNEVHSALSEIIEGQLFLSSYEVAQDIGALKIAGITHVLSVAKEIYSDFRLPEEAFQHRLLCIEDYDHTGILPYFDETNRFIEEAIESKGRVLVHCMMGLSRSVSIVVAYIMKLRKTTAELALKYVESKRGWVSPNEGFQKQLKLYELMQCSIVGDTKYHKLYEVLNIMWKRGEKKLLELPEDDFQLEQVPKPKCYYCDNCGHLLFSVNNLYDHTPYHIDLPFTDEDCPHHYVKPTKWMMIQNPNVISHDKGVISCPNCKTRLGNWNWRGTICEECNAWTEPSFRIDKLKCTVNKPSSTQ